MVFKIAFVAVALVCCIEMSAADDGRRGSNYFILGNSGGRDYSGERRTYVQPRAERVYVRPSSGYRQSGGYGNDYNLPAKYQFAYRARANGGYGKQGYGGDGYASGSSAEFGHSESRDGDKTTGAYFVELPDGRLQRVDYYVDGYSGYVARVSYSGKGGYSGEKTGYRRENY